MKDARWTVLAVLASAAMVIVSLIRGTPGEIVPAGELAPAPTHSAVPSPSQLRLDDDFARSGPGTFVLDRSAGPVLGSAGTLRRFHIAVEGNITQEIDEFARVVDAVLGDPRSWTASRQLRFQRVPEGVPADFTIHLVTRVTADKMCATGGMDIRVDGVPFTSCRLAHKVVINLDRWRLSVPDYVNGGVPLETYRQYVINHEVGHELGHGHEACPAPGRPAPTMSTQTLGLNGCTANPWPFLDGKRYAGPPVA
jgi:hypothetical protein